MAFISSTASVLCRLVGLRPIFVGCLVDVPRTIGGAPSKSISSPCVIQRLYNYIRPCHNLQVPNTEEKLQRFFYERWNFSHYISTMDGKHYKHSFSIVLLAIVDANYQFLYVDVGCNGRISDCGVFRNCDLYTELEENRLNM